MLFEYSGYISGILVLLAAVPYVIGIFQGHSKPERMAWFIWSALGGISFFSQMAKGAGASLWLTGFQTLHDLIIFLLAIKYGMGGMLRRDKIALALAVASLVLWYVTGEAAVALFTVIFADAIGGVLTIIKTYEHPTTEPLSAWVLTFIAGLFAIVSVGKFDWILLAYPIYIFVINLAISLTIILGLRREKKVIA